MTAANKEPAGTVSQAELLIPPVRKSEDAKEAASSGVEPQSEDASSANKPGGGGTTIKNLGGGILAGSKNAEGIRTGPGIAEARFIEDMEQFVNGRDITVVVNAFQDLHAKYKYLESTLLTQKQALKTKIPDIEGALEIVQHLRKKKEEDESAELQVKYNLSENIWVNADVPVAQGTIMLWLGANCMLEYPLEEAEELLSANLAAAKKQLDSVKSDAIFVRDQVVTTEVNVARCHNFGVMERQKKKALENEEEAKKDDAS